MTQLELLQSNIYLLISETVMQNIQFQPNFNLTSDDLCAARNTRVPSRIRWGSGLTISPNHPASTTCARA
jgi:hypothetical protein